MALCSWSTNKSTFHDVLKGRFYHRLLVAWAILRPRGKPRGSASTAPMLQANGRRMEKEHPHDPTGSNSIKQISSISTLRCLYCSVLFPCICMTKLRFMAIPSNPIEVLNWLRFYFEPTRCRRRCQSAQGHIQSAVAQG